MATEQRFQFLRIEPRRCSKAQDLLMEADRVPSHCAHVPEPMRPVWFKGSRSAVSEATATLMEAGQFVRDRRGQLRIRKTRHDFRGLSDCVASYPISIEELRSATLEQRDEYKRWLSDTNAFLEKEFPGKIIGACIHFDEGYPHQHYFIVGAAQHTHPGLKAELENGRRLEDGKERVRRYRKAMVDFLDRYHTEVSSRYGHLRRGNSRPQARIKDRATFEILKEANRVERAYGGEILSGLLDKFRRRATYSRPLSDRKFDNEEDGLEHDGHSRQYRDSDK